MKFRTKIKSLDVHENINHQSNIIMLGSCFTDNIGERLNQHHFKVKINPFGIVFNPLSLLKQLKGEEGNDQHLIQFKHSVNSLDFHSKYFAEDKAGFKLKLAKDQKQFKENLSEANYLILTFGTAWAYRFKSTNKIIANCQKQKGDAFTKELIDLQQLVNEYIYYFEKLFSDQPNLKVVLTVSPVRHLKDGLIDNNRSKAILILLCSKLSQTFPNHVKYYPSYEIVIDDLRDYRFFEKDLLHPNAIAVDYIYEHFQESFFDEKTIELIQLIEKYNLLKNHISINSSAEEVKLQEQKLNDLNHQINHLKTVT